MNCSEDMRFLTLSWATMTAPVFPRFSLPPTWSPCQCVFRRKRTGWSLMRGDRGLDLVRQRRVLAVDHEDAVGAGRDADVAAGAGQHLDAFGELLGLDLDLAEILLGDGGEGREGGEGGGENEFVSHGMILCGTDGVYHLALFDESPGTVLVVDDDVQVRGLLVALLRPRGYQVETAGSAEEAQERLRTLQPDVLLLDLHLPERADRTSSRSFVPTRPRGSCPSS